MQATCFCGNDIQGGNTFGCARCRRPVCIPCVLGMDNDVRCPDCKNVHRCFCDNEIQAPEPDRCGRCKRPVCIPCLMTMDGDVRCPECAVQDADDQATLALIRAEQAPPKRPRTEKGRSWTSEFNQVGRGDTESPCVVCNRPGAKMCKRGCEKAYCYDHSAHACEPCDVCQHWFKMREPRISCTLCRNRMCRECWDAGHQCPYQWRCDRCNKVWRRRVVGGIPVTCVDQGCLEYSCPSCQSYMDKRLPHTVCVGHMRGLCAPTPCVACGAHFPLVYSRQLVMSRVIPMTDDARYVVTCAICHDRLRALRMSLWRLRLLPKQLIDLVVMWACTGQVCRDGVN